MYGLRLGTSLEKQQITQCMVFNLRGRTVWLTRRIDS